MKKGRTVKLQAGKGTWTRYAQEVHDAAFLGYGREFLTTAGKTGSPLVRAYLLGHALEIFLKVFLLQGGMRISQLRGREYGHDLSALVSECRQGSIEQKVRLSPKLIRELDAFSIVYASKGFEYFDILYLIGPPQLPKLDRLFQFARLLQKALSST